jgi:hypothetical protein
VSFRRCLLVLALLTFALAAGLPALSGAQGGVCSPSTPQYCPPPRVKTGPAKHVTTRAARLTGAVNPNGSATSCFFKYGKTRAYGSTTRPQNAGSGDKTVRVRANATGLAPRTTYHYRLVCRNLGGRSGGKDRKFQTGRAPTVTTERARRRTGMTVTLLGTVNPNGLSTRCMFKYGRTDSYGSTTAVRSVGSGTRTRPLTARVGGLAPKTVYHFRLFCTNAAGARHGRDRRVETKNRIRFRGARTIPVSGQGRFTVRLRCAGNHQCVGFLTLTGRGAKRLAKRVRYVVGSHQTVGVRMRLTQSALAELSGGHQLAARLRARDLDGSAAARRVALHRG